MASRYIRLPQALNDLTYASALALFMLMLFVPTSYQTIKAALLALVMSGIVWGFFIGTVTIALHRLIMVWVAVIVLTGVFFITRGWLNDAPGAIRVGTVYVLWPLVFIVLIAAIPGRGGATGSAGHVDDCGSRNRPVRRELYRERSGLVA